MTAPLLELKGVHTHIGAYHILHGVDFSVPEGEVTMLLGRNGAGNITLTGLAAGDVISHVQNVTDGGNITSSFTSPVASANTLAQIAATDLSAKTILVTVKTA